MDLTATIAPRSDQLNADDLVAGPRTITVTDVTAGTPDQPVNIITNEYGPDRPYKPGKSMRRVLVQAWGAQSDTYKGRRITIYRDPKIKFGRDEVGGIRISHLSHIDKPLTLALTVTRGKRAPFTVQPLPDQPAPGPQPGDDQAAAKQELWAAWTAGHGNDSSQLAAAFAEQMGAALAEASPDQMREYAATLRGDDA